MPPPKKYLKYIIVPILQNPIYIAFCILWVGRYMAATIDTSPPKARKNVGINVIISRAHSYEIYEEGIGRYRFVDRDNEIRKILKSSEYLFLGGRITVLYGSKGCGKSTLFRAMGYALEDVPDIELITIAARELEAARRVVLNVRRSMRDLLQRIVNNLGIRADWIDFTTLTITGGVSLLGAAWEIARLIKYAVVDARESIDKRILIAIDEVKADSPGHLSSFRQWLESFANELREINGEIVEKKGGGVAVIALTSDALIKELRDVVDGKVDWALMWNLPRNAFEEHISQIGLQHRVARELGISSEEAKEILWRLSGGNPRALELIWKKGIKKWLEDEVLRNLSDLVEELRKPFGEKLWEELERASNSIDDADIDLKKAMLRKNIIIYIAGADKISEMPREQWIGKKYAYQIPAYYHALKAMARKRSTDIEPEEIIREAMG
jgi:energy-coupling factor transporter ATP-binding protein EcfA2